MTVASPTDDERVAIDRLLGRRSRGRDLTVKLADVDDALHRTSTTLVDVVTAAVGVIEDRPAARSASAAEEASMWESVAAHPVLARHAFVAAWVERLRTTGRWRRLDDPPRRLGEALDVLAALPVLERTGRSRLAVEVIGDAHALDDTAPLGRLVLAALAEGRPVSTTAARRELWAGYGVVADETSSTVLTAGLRPTPAGPVTEGARRWADGRVPLVIPLAAVDAESWRMGGGTRVWVCENPAVVAVAASIGAPVVCVEGQPSLAATRLLSSLTAGGASLAYHGDFGAGGIAIANTIIGGLGARPWRLSTAD
ncbi:MAG: TIGR02679 family protein [Acidimicrobiales bacterium]